jgi:transposase
MSQLEPARLAIALMKASSQHELIALLRPVMAEMETEQALAFLADLLSTLQADRDHLKQRLAHLLAAQFARRSEKSSPDQLDLFAQILRGMAEHTDGDEPTDAPPTPKKTAAELIAQTEAEITELTEQRRAARQTAKEAAKAARALEGAANPDAVPWPTHLPVREEYLPVPAEHSHCGDCGCERQVMRYQTSWRLESQTTTEVVVTYLPVVGCPSHHGGPLTAPVPPKPVDKGQLGFRLAARLLWLRCTHNLPVHRLAEMMQAEGVPVSETMIHTLIETTGERLKPLAEALHQAVQSAGVVNLDDTPTDVHVGHRDRERRRSRVWLALGDEKYAWFFATQSWKAKEAESALGPLRGVLQGDGYRGFPQYARSHGLELAGCMAHLRRKLRKAVEAKDPRAGEAMALVQGLYRVEKLAELQGVDVAGRQALRQERSVPLMAALLGWGRAVESSIVKGSPLGQAWSYLRNQQGPLQVYLSDGSVSIDNSAAERGLRRITIGRKLWLFFRGQSKLEHVCRLMSVVTTARLQGVEELGYLSWVLEQLARREWSAAAARQLLPDAWLALQQQSKEVSASQA